MSGYALIPRGRANLLYMTGCVQCEQRLAPAGISLKHSGHFLVVGSAGGPLRDLPTRMFIGFTTKKNMVEATRTNEIMALMKCPYLNSPPLNVKERPPMSGTRATADIKGVMKSATSALTIAVNAAQTTTPTARPTTF